MICEAIEALEKIVRASNRGRAPKPPAPKPDTGPDS